MSLTKVYDGYSFNGVSVDMHSVGCADGYVVQQTESVAIGPTVFALNNTSRTSMVTGRPHCTEGVAKLMLHNQVHALTHSPSSEEGGGKGVVADSSISVEVADPAV